jgi:hypothetical protein
MAVKLRGSLDVQRFYDIPKKYLSNKFNNETWRQFKFDEPVAYFSLVLSVTLGNFLFIFKKSSNYSFIFLFSTPYGMEHTIQKKSNW